MEVKEGLVNRFKYYFFYGFSKRLFFSNMVIFVIAIIIFFYITYYQTSKILKERIVSSNQEILDEAANNIEKYMDDVEHLTFNISTNNRVQNFLTDTHEKTDFESVLEQEELINQMLTVDVFVQKTQSVILFAEYQDKYPVYNDRFHKAIVYSGKGGVCRAVEVRDMQWYKDAVDERGRVVWEILNQGKQVLMAVRGVINTKNLNETVGVIQVVADNNRFKQVMEKIRLGDDGIVCMKAGDIILWGGDEHPEIKKSLSQKTDGGMHRVINGKKFCFINSKLGESDWQLIGAFPENTMLDSYNILNGILLPALGIAVAFSFIMIKINARKLARPIQNISDVMDNYDLNNKKRLETERTDEIGVLCRSYNRMMDYIDKLLVEVQETSNRKRKAELQALQAQINPHFLYNTLDCIKNYAYLNDNKEIVVLTTSLSDFFRISLNKGSEILPLFRELDHVRSYCKILQFRSRIDFDLQINVPENLLKRPVIKLILQPLVENSIQHGMVDKTSKGIIQINAEERENYLILSVIDNGEGGDIEFLNGLLSGEYKAPSDGRRAYGIINIDERIRLSYGDSSGLKYKKTPEGWLVAEIWIRNKKEVENKADVNESNTC